MKRDHFSTILLWRCIFSKITRKNAPIPGGSWTITWPWIATVSTTSPACHTATNWWGPRSHRRDLIDGVYRFSVEDMLTATRDQPFLASLMYYLGVLTIAGSDPMGRLALTIPQPGNPAPVCGRRIRDALLPEYEDRETARRAANLLHQWRSRAPVRFHRNPLFSGIRQSGLSVDQ